MVSPIKAYNVNLSFWLLTCISCRRLMTLIIDNLTKGNRKNIESALIRGQLNPDVAKNLGILL